MNTRQVQREVANDVGRDVSFREGFIPLWGNDFTQQGVQNGLTLTRASSAGYTNRDGVWVVAPADTPRLDHYDGSLIPKGLLCEEPRTNYLLNSTAPATQTVSLATGTYTLILVGSGSCAAAVGTAVGTGFGTANASNPLVFTLTAAGTVVFTVSGSVGRFQCENGAFSTSFIVTSTSAATRSADVCGGSLSGIINPNEGTFLLHCIVTPNTKISLGLDDGNGGGVTRAHFSASATSQLLYMMIGGSPKANLQSYLTLMSGSVVKMAFSYSASGVVCAINGQISGTSSSAATNFTVASARLGCRYFPAASNFMNGHVQKVGYLPSALGSSQLQQITE